MNKIARITAFCSDQCLCTAPLTAMRQYKQFSVKLQLVKGYKMESIKNLKAMEIESMIEYCMKAAAEGEEIPKSIQKRINEYERVLEMKEFDNKFSDGFIVGIDEAGRGPLAGDVYTAAVILPRDVVIEGINDSKKLSEKKRDALFDEIKEKALAYCVYTADAELIDALNIRNATYFAMNKAAEGLNHEFSHVLVDGDMIRDMAFPHTCVVKGDSKSMAIAAASILAKVSRDRYMTEMDSKYPGYGFAKHKGYGTREHIEAIKHLGPCEIHRRTFIKNFV